MNYDNLDFTGGSLADRTDMNGLTITGLCLSQEKPDSHVLPANLTGTTFINCNLDNVLIPSGNTVIGCSVRRFKCLDDGQDWLIDENDQPIRLLNS